MQLLPCRARAFAERLHRIDWNSLGEVHSPSLGGYRAKRIEVGADMEESAKANDALAKIFPIMILLTMIVIIIQVRSFSGLALVLLTAHLGLLGAVPTLIFFHQAFGLNAILALIGLAGILMRNTLIFMEQIKSNLERGLSQYDAVLEATGQRARPVILTALAPSPSFAADGPLQSRIGNHWLRFTRAGDAD
ncbi:hypothetical protein DBL06_20095 [Agrobacterium pusense]|nr:hypothetical protein DBL06_20095 [Agrobacterium pusense]